MKYSFEEYQMYFATTAAVTDQRISLNRWNYSVCTAIVVGLGLFLAWSADKPRFFILVSLSLVVLSLAGALFCIYWMRQITALKLLNGAKFKVLNEMAPLVKFPNDTISNQPFAKEWEELSRTGGVRKISRLQGRLALSSSGAELFVPRAFAALFLTITFASLVCLILGLSVPSVRQYLPISPDPAEAVGNAIPTTPGASPAGVPTR